MNDCPNDDFWPRWLKRELIPVPHEQHSLIRHLETCGLCRRQFLKEYVYLKGAHQVKLDEADSLVERLLQLMIEPVPVPSQPRPAEPSDLRPVSNDPTAAGSTLAPKATPRQRDEPNPEGPAIRSPSVATSAPTSIADPRSTKGPIDEDALPVVVGHYRVTRKIGEGAMGIVFEAEDIRNQKRVALKLMKPELAQNEVTRQRFLREARIATSFRHPNIVAIHEVGEFAGTPYLAMEYLVGESLRERLKRDGPMSWREACELGEQVAQALAAAHQRGLIHRDIKPANIWLQHPGRHVKLLDFGLARFQLEYQDVELTKSGTIVGTPAYMSPEQIRGLELDDRTDLFSLGVVLYECMVGKRPFRGNDLYAVITQVLTENPPSPAQVRPEIPEVVSDYIMRLLHKDREKRPRNAVDVAEVLRQLAQGKFCDSSGASSRAAGAVSPKALSANSATPPFTDKPRVYRPSSVTDADRHAERNPVAAVTSEVRKRKKRRKKTYTYWRMLIVSLAILVPMLTLYWLVSSFWHWYHHAQGTLVLEIDETAQAHWANTELYVYDASRSPVAVLRGTTKQVFLRPGSYTVQCVGDPDLEPNKSEVIIQPRQATVLLVRRKVANNSPPTPAKQPSSPIVENAQLRQGQQLLAHLASREPHSVVTLPAGRYLLPSKLVLLQPITLIGAGADQTILTTAEADAVVECRAPGLVRLQQLSLEYTGTAPANVVVISAGSVQLEDCVCRGARTAPSPQPVGPSDASLTAGQTDTPPLPSYGNGIVILCPLEVTIRNCRLVGNEKNGLLVFFRNPASVRFDILVEECHLRDNGEAGIRFDGWARCTVRRNHCVNNAYGILVAGRAAPLLEGNYCGRNRMFGIAFREQSVGYAYDNQCQDNASGDFLLESSSGARPVLGNGNVGGLVTR